MSAQEQSIALYKSNQQVRGQHSCWVLGTVLSRASTLACVGVGGGGGCTDSQGPVLLYGVQVTALTAKGQHSV